MNRQEFIKKIYSRNYINKIISKVKLLGTNDNTDPYNLLITRLITSVILFCLCLYNYKYGYIIAPIVTVIYYNVFNEMTLDSKIRKRNSELEKEAMHFFEVLTLSLETGRNLSEAIDVTTSNVDGVLSNEFKESIREITFGKSLSEALNDMQERIPSDTINNVILSRFYGICPFLGVSKKVDTALGMSAAVAFVLTIATIVTFLIQKFVLDAFDLGYLQTITFILVIAALVQMVEIVLKKVSPALYQALGVFLPLITTNCCILGVAILVIQKDYDLLTGVVYAISTALGFGLALTLFAGLREQMSLVKVPKGMQGTPIALITAGLLAMAFMGFSGVVKI